jgi:hypothetical protein
VSVKANPFGLNPSIDMMRAAGRRPLLTAQILRGNRKIRPAMKRSEAEPHY